MKKLLGIIIIILSAGVLLHADLTSDIPFEPNIVGPSYNDSTYTYMTEYFYIFNEGSGDDFTLTVQYESSPVPTGWQLMWCHELHGSGGCHMVPPEGYPPIPWNFTFNAGDTLKLDFQVTVGSSGSLSFSFTFEAASLTEPYVLDFSYTTAASVDNPGFDNVSYVNAPNPFSNTTTIFFDMKNTYSNNLALAIYDIKGRVVRNYALNPGQTSVIWDGKNSKGEDMSNGVYYYTILIDEQVNEPQKLLLLR